MSFWLEIRKRDTGETKLAKKLPDPPTGRVGPYTLRHWADREGLEIEYIDNCHVKVPVDRDRLLPYLSELYEAHHPYPASELPILTSEWEFVLEAEEF
jgi:hypothetical protein